MLFRRTNRDVVARQYTKNTQKTNALRMLNTDRVFRINPTHRSVMVAGWQRTDSRSKWTLGANHHRAGGGGFNVISSVIGVGFTLQQYTGNALAKEI